MVATETIVCGYLQGNRSIPENSEVVRKWIRNQYGPSGRLEGGFESVQVPLQQARALQQLTQGLANPGGGGGGG